LHDQRCGSETAASADTGVLRMLRLAFDRARSLAPRSRHQAVSGVSGCTEGAHCARVEFDTVEHCDRRRLPHGAWTRLVRAAVWACMVAATGSRVAKLERPAVPRVVGHAGAAGNGRSEEAHDMAAEARLPDSDRRA